MQELEKILEEIKQEKLKHWDSSERLETDKLIGWCFDKCADIIRKHMNDGWILTEKHLPKKGGKDVWYLVQVIGGKKPYMILNFHDEYEVFGEIERDRFLGDHIRGTAYRWCPLPETYRPERSDNHDGE